MQIEVLPVPTEPEIRTVFPRGMPPFRMWSIASMPVTHRSRSSSECSVAGIDSVVTTRRAIFEVTALSIRSESRCCKTSQRIRTAAPFRRLLSSVDDFERVVPAAGAHPDEHPEGDRRLQPPRGLDPPEVEGPGPAELLHDAADRRLEDLLDRRAEGREDDDLSVLGRFFEGPRRGLPLPLHRPKPLRQALALRIPRADHHIVAAGREAASEGLPNIAAPQDADFHGRAKGSALFPDLDLSGRPRHGPMAQGPVVTYLSSARGRRGPWSRSSRWPWTTCTSSGPSSPPRRRWKEERTGSRPARP